MIYILQRERTEYSGSSISDRYESIERSYYESVEDAQNAIEALKEEKKKDNPDLKYHEGKNSISFDINICSVTSVQYRWRIISLSHS